jgi:hypothetical protein
LRRAIRPFTVEVRRRPRLATSSTPEAQSATKPPQAVDRESHRAAASAIDPQMTDPSSVDVVASHPTGRILPSLVSSEPWHRRLEDGPVSAADSETPSREPKRPAVRAPNHGDRASKSLRNSSFPSDGNALSAEGSLTKSDRTSSLGTDEEPIATPRDPARAPSPIVGAGSGLGLSAKGRKRIIMARYVFGDGDKPGERWKRRLLGSR